MSANSALCSQTMTGSASRIGRGHQPDHVGRRRRRDDLEARDGHRPVLDALAVLGAEAQAGAVGRPQHERQRHLAVGHVAGLGDLVDDHVPGHREEVGEHQLGDRAQAGHRRAHRRADDRLLADRRVADAVGPELGEQAFGQLEHAAGRPDVLADRARPIGSRRISWAMPRAMAAAVRQFRHDEPPSAQTWVSSTSARRLGRGAGLGLGRGDRVVRLGLDGVERRRVDAGRLEPRPVGRDRVARLPGRDLVVRPVLARVGPRVAAVAVGQRLDERRPVAGARPVDGRPRDLVDRVDVVAVDEDRLEAVGGRPVRGRVLDRGHRADRRVLHVLVVLADEDDRRLPDRGHVERLVERPDVGRPVAEEADRDLAGLAVLRRPGRAQGDRQVGADDGVRAHHPVLDATSGASSRPCRRAAPSRARTARRRSAPSARPGRACGCGRGTCRTCSRRRASPRRPRPRPPPGRRRGGSSRGRGPRRTAPGRGPRSSGTRPSSGTSGAGCRGRCRGRSSPFGPPGRAVSTRWRRTARRTGSG